ncbi:MAG: hypothetical protein L3J11_09290 [Draconibacterium sp.]|nr:hypothetical protein [Draconibacterium sp.]
MDRLYVDGLPKEIDHKLTKRYENFFKLFLKQCYKIDRVTFWGTSDDHSCKTIFRYVDKLPPFIRQET